MRHEAGKKVKVIVEGIYQIPLHLQRITQTD